MLNLPIIIISTAITSAALSGYAAWDWQRARCAAAAKKALEVHVEVMEKELLKAAHEARVEQARAVLAAEQRNSRNLTAREVIREVAVADRDGTCEWSADHSMRLGRIYEAFGADPSPRAPR